MITSPLSQAKARLSYFLMKKPIPYFLLGNARRKVKEARQRFEDQRETKTKIKVKGLSYVVHRFNSGSSKKALVVHGWMSEAPHMILHIENLIANDFEVIAIDLPAHGEASGQFCSWKNAVNVILDIQKRESRFDLVLGHSFGAGMLSNAALLKNIDSEFKSILDTDKFVLLSGALTINTPLEIYSKSVLLNKKQRKIFEGLVQKELVLPISELTPLKILKEYPSNSKYLLIHGTKDGVVDINESRDFAKLEPQVKLVEVEGFNHIQVLYRDDVFPHINDFIKNN
jgi:alpha-beta hydrolase superfamily lysophospholipase